MSELVKDPVYNKYLRTLPKVPEVFADRGNWSSPPWVVYVQRRIDGPWGKREFWTYREAFQFFKRALKAHVHDVAINCKRVGFDPPHRLVRLRGKFVVGSDGVKRQATKMVTWAPRLEPGDPQHHWCRYCRRPTVFRCYRRHRRLPHLDPTVPRCCICGASARIALDSKDRRFRFDGAL